MTKKTPQKVTYDPSDYLNALPPSPFVLISSGVCCVLVLPRSSDFSSSSFPRELPFGHVYREDTTVEVGSPPKATKLAQDKEKTNPNEPVTGLKEVFYQSGLSLTSAAHQAHSPVCFARV
jgi:hypothetical protein